MKSFISDLFRVGLSNLYIMIFGVGTSVLTARFLSPEQNGQISAILVYPSLFMVFGSLGIRQSTTYFVGKKIYEIETIQRAITQIWLFTSFVSVFVCYYLIKLFTKNISDETSILLSIMTIPFTLYNTYSSGIYLGKSEIKKFNRINWVPNFVTFLTTFVLLFFFNFKLNGALFVDAGNIWNVLDNVDDEKSVFKNLNSLKNSAVGSGFGLRPEFRCTDQHDGPYLVGDWPILFCIQSDQCLLRGFLNGSANWSTGSDHIHRSGPCPGVGGCPVGAG